MLSDSGQATIGVEDPRSPDVQQLLASHLAFCRGESPPEDVHALDLDGLLQPEVTLYGFRRDGLLLGVGALKVIDAGHGEIKSMHTDRSARRMGVGAVLLSHIVAEARRRGLSRLSLETGSMASFAPARAMYERAGFVPTGPFADYPDSPNSAYMTMVL